MPIRQSAPPYDWFTHGRRQAWAPPPGPSRFAAIAAPAVQGAASGLGYYMGNRPLTEQLNGNPAMPSTVTTPGQPAYPDPMGEAPGVIGGFPSSSAMQSPDPMGEAPLGSAIPPPPPGETIEQRAKRIRQRWLWQQLAAYSSRTLKDDITRADERRSLREVMATPTYTYRYKDEATPERIGPMAEEVPERWQTQVNGRAGIRMPVMLGALHAATRALARDVRSLKEQLRG